MRICVIKVQDEPIEDTHYLRASVQELCGKTITVNVSDNGYVCLDTNPQLRVHTIGNVTTGVILAAREFKIIMEKTIE